MFFLTSCFLLSLVCNASTFVADGNTDKDLENLDGPDVDEPGNYMTETHDSEAECVETCKKEWCWVELTEEKCQSKCVKRCSNPKKESDDYNKPPHNDCVRDCMDKMDKNPENRHLYRRECKDACDSFLYKEPDHSDEHSNDWEVFGELPIAIGDYSVIDCVKDCMDKKDVTPENRHLYRRECKDACDSLQYKEPDHANDFGHEFNVAELARSGKGTDSRPNSRTMRMGGEVDNQKQKEKEAKKQQKNEKKSRKKSMKSSRIFKVKNEDNAGGSWGIKSRSRSFRKNGKKQA